MATSGTIKGSCKTQAGAATSKYSTWIYWVRNSVNTTGNYSNITVYVRVQRSDGYTGETAWSKESKPTVTLKVGGATKSPTINYIDTRNQVVCTFATWTGNVNHNADGTLALALSCSWTLKNVSSLGSGSISGTATLDTIPRASQPSCITYPEHTQKVGYFGDTISIHMNRHASTFTHTVRYQFGSTSGTIATGVTTGTTWTIPMSLINLLPESTYGSGTIYVDTYSGSTKIGTKSCGFTASVPASVKPSCTLTLDDIMGVDNIYGSPVKGLSKIKATVNATQAYGSPITKYQITANGATYSSSTATTDFLRTSGKSTVTAKVWDKRGRSGTVSLDMNVQDYSKPRITQLAVHRCDEDGTENDRGEYVKVEFSAEVSSLSSKNTALYKLLYKKSTDSSYTTISLSELTNQYSVDEYTYIFAADGSSSYDVDITATDRHGTESRSTSASTAFTLINYHPSGTAIRFGGVAEEQNTFQNDLIFVQRENQYCFSSIGAASTDGYILMARITITATNSDTPITFVFSRRKAIAPMTVHICFASTADTEPTLSSIVYEGANYGAFLTNTAPGVWDLYVQKVSNSDTITLNRWHTSYRQMKRISVEFVGSIVSQVPTGLSGYYRAIPMVSESILDCFFPVGHIMLLYSHADPNVMYPGSTWERITNTLLWATTEGGVIGWVSAQAAKATSGGYAFTQISVWRRTA
jgi:hypothetical protein